MLFVGCFLEPTAAITILVPILLPIVQQLGIDPVHFGLVMVLNLMIGLLHPPMGMVLFVLARVAKLSVERTTMAILPWLVPLLGQPGRSSPMCRETRASWLPRNVLLRRLPCCKPPTLPSACIPPTTSSSRAASSSRHDAVEGERARRAALIPPATRSRRAPSRRASRCAATTRSSASRRSAIARRRARAHAQPRRWATSSATTPSAPTCKPTALVDAAGDLHGHRPRRRPRRHAQLHRHPDQVNCSATVARAIADHFRATIRGAGGLSRTSTAWSRSRTAPAAAWTATARACTILRRTLARLRARTPTSPACWSSAWAARRTRSTACSTHESLQRRRRRCSAVQHPGHGRHAQDGARTASRCVKEMLPQRQRASRASRCRRSAHHRRPAVRRLGRLLGHHAPTRRSARRSTCWCATAAPRSCRRRPRSTAPSTC